MLLYFGSDRNHNKDERRDCQKIHLCQDCFPAVLCKNLMRAYKAPKYRDCSDTDGSSERTMDVETHIERNSREIAKCSSSRDLRSPETIILLSDDDEDDKRTPSKRSISEYFTPCKEQPAGTSSTWTTGGKRTTSATASAEKAAPKTVPKKGAGKVRRRICPTTNIKMLTKKYFDDSQKRITKFFTNKEEGSERMGYCRVLNESTMPVIITGDLDVEQMLEISVVERTNRLGFSQNPSGGSSIPIPSQEAIDMSPSEIMERLERVQSACYDPVREDWNMERVQVPIVVGGISSNGDTPGDSGTLSAARQTLEIVESVGTSRAVPSSEIVSKRKSKIPVAQSHTPRANKKKAPQPRGRSKIVCPKYKIIAGTTFAVDAFRYGNIEGVTHYFLTHFHADHYIGLKKSFSKPLIMSPITARLVKAFINVPEEHYLLIELHQSLLIDGVEITALDANHCPGAVMFLFRLPNGTNILHTGDFRASPEMEEYPEFWNMAIDSIYLDTTYLLSKYAFKPQWESVADARAAVAAYLKKHIGTEVLIVCGSYLIGKEKVWLELAIASQLKVWTEPNRWKALKAVADPNQLQLLVADPNKANIHVLAMNKLTYDELNEYVNQFPDRYDSVIAIRPSGWEKNSKPQYRGRINIVGIEYSEHSSFDELKRFVQYIRPREVISTVPYGNSNQNRTPSVPLSWYQGEIRPQRKALQLSITSFMPNPGANGNGRLKNVSSIPKNLTMAICKKEETKRECRMPTNDCDVIDLDSEDNEENIQRSDNGEISVDSDWMS